MEETKPHIELIHRYATYLDSSDPILLKELGDELLEKCQYKVLNFMEHHFSPIGYTCIWLLGESHLAIHTFPEKKTSYLELSSCNKEKNQQFQLLLEAKLIPPD